MNNFFNYLFLYCPSAGIIYLYIISSENDIKINKKKNFFIYFYIRLFQKLLLLEFLKFSINIFFEKKLIEIRFFEEKMFMLNFRNYGQKRVFGKV